MIEIDDLQTLSWRFAEHRVITVANRTGMLSLLAQEAGSGEQIAERLGLDPLATGKMLRALHALGIVESSSSGYRLDAGLAPHFQPGPSDMAPFLAHVHSMYERWGQSLEGWVRGEPPLRGGPPDPAAFGAAMQAMGSYVSGLAAETLDLGGVETMLDVGGSFGHYARAFCRVNKQLRATVFDRPDVVDLGREKMAAHPEAERIAFKGGDYLQDDLGQQAYDLVLASNILHQQSSEEAAALTRRCAAAVAPGGRLVVLDFAIDDARQQNLLGALFAINMRSFGDTYTEPTIRTWITDAGLGEVERVALGQHRWLIIGRRS